MKWSLENIGMSSVRMKQRNVLYVAASAKMSAPSSAGREQHFSVQGRCLRRVSAPTWAVPRGCHHHGVMSTVWVFF